MAWRFNKNWQNGRKMKILICRKGKSGVLAWNMQCLKVNKNLKFTQSWDWIFFWKKHNIWGPTYWFSKFGEIGMKEQKVLENWKNLFADFCLHWCFRVKKIFSIFKNFLLFHASLIKFIESLCWTKKFMFFSTNYILLHFGRI